MDVFLKNLPTKPHGGIRSALVHVDLRTYQQSLPINGTPELNRYGRYRSGCQYYSTLWEGPDVFGTFPCSV